FFFSSRRRHTRSYGDWSSDVCSSDLFGLARGVVLVSAGSLLGASAAFFIGRTLAREWTQQRIAAWPRFRALDGALGERGLWIVRSEERRVGKEGRWRGGRGEGRRRER